MMMFLPSWKEAVQKIEWCPKLLKAWRIHEATPFGLFFLKNVLLTYEVKFNYFQVSMSTALAISRTNTNMRACIPMETRAVITLSRLKCGNI
jgi:hypothetical protein